MHIYPYKPASESAKALALAMDVKRIRHENSSFKGGEEKVVINWGSSSLPEEVRKCMIVNQPEAVSIAKDKLSFFGAMKDHVSIPEFTTDIGVAKQWLEGGSTVVGRLTLSGHSGQGIVIFEPSTYVAEEMIGFPLYTKYVPKKDEYRVHVVKDEAVDIRRKGHVKGRTPSCFKVRSCTNGYIFLKENVEAPQQVVDEAIKAVQVCGLDFGAVDVIYNHLRDKAYVLEINTAPGLEGSTVDTYAENLVEMFELKPKKRRMSQSQTTYNFSGNFADIPGLPEQIYETVEDLPLEDSEF